MTNQVQQGALALRDRLLDKAQQIQRLWPGAARDGTVQRFCDAVATCVVQSPALLQDPAGVIREALVAARVGLDPAPALHHCAIVPFKAGGRVRATLIIEYQGMAHILWRHNQILVDAEAVYERDTFRYRETAEGTDFEWSPADTIDRGELRGAWARMRFPDGRCKTRYLTGSRIRAIKAIQVGKGKGAGKPSPWEDPIAEPEMWAKTALRALFKLAPKDGPVVQDLARAMDREDAPPEHMVEVDVDVSPAPDDPDPPASSPMDAAAQEVEKKAKAVRSRPDPNPPEEPGPEDGRLPWDEPTAAQDPDVEVDPWSTAVVAIQKKDRKALIDLAQYFGRELPGIAWDDALAHQKWGDDVEFSRQPTNKLALFAAECLGAARKCGASPP